MYAQNEKVMLVNISEQMQQAYIDYSMSVIVGRALPDARDGLKPSNRRVLYAMRDALVKVVAENRRRKLPLDLWRNGKVVKCRQTG